MANSSSAAIRRVARKAQQSKASSVLDARSQKAWKAVRHFTGMLPQFTSFARMATGNGKIVVRLGESGAQTDGSAIFIAPPIALGEERVHTRHLCDKRGPSKRQLCKACDAMEVINFYLFHEIAHIAFDSMARPMNYLVDRVEDMIDEWHPPGVCSHSGYMKRQLQLADQYMKLSAVHNGFLPIIFNALEDARVNARMFQARPGLRVMFEAGIQKIFEDGIDRKDGTHFEWSAAPPNSQVIIGLFLLASGTRIEPGYFAENEAEALEDPELIKLCSRVVMTRSAHQVMEVTLEAYRRLDAMGYCSVPRCEPVPQMPAPPSGQGDEENDANQQTDGSPSESDDDSDGDSSDSGSSSGSSSSSESSKSESNGDDDDSGAGESSGEDTGPAEDEPSGGSGEEPGSAEADDSDDTVEDGSRNGAGGSDDESDQQDDSSADAPLRGTDNDHEAPEREDESEASSSAGGAGTRNDDDGDDSSDVEGTADPEDQGGTGEHDSSDQDDPMGDSGASSGSSEESQDGDSSPGEEDDGDETDEDVQSTDDTSGGPGDEGGTDEGARQKGDASVWDEEFGDADQAFKSADEPEAGGEPEPYGDPSDVEELVKIFGGHRVISGDDDDQSTIDHQHFGEEDEHEHAGEHPHERETRAILEKQAVNVAVKQSASFDTASRYLTGLDVYKYPQASIRWCESYIQAPVEEFMPAESIMGGAVMKARLVFEDNRRAKEVRHLKSGRVDARVLGRRAPFGDPRIFSKRQRPGKKDYFVAIGVDCSGSTAWAQRNPRIKRAVFVQAELLHRLGIPFAIYGMTGGNQNNLLSAAGYDDPEIVAMLEIKGPGDPWSKDVRTRLAHMQPIAENYDGHNLEFLRKVCDSRTETKRIIIYYTDGAMPAANEDEELVILQTELLNCKKKKYPVLAVGINTDSPRQYGLDTVQVDSDEDIHLVIEQLDRKLTER